MNQEHANEDPYIEAYTSGWFRALKASLLDPNLKGAEISEQCTPFNDKVLAKAFVKGYMDYWKHISSF